MCGNADCVPFGCVVGEAIAHVGGVNIAIGLSLIFISGAMLGYVVGARYAKNRMERANVVVSNRTDKVDT